MKTLQVTHFLDEDGLPCVSVPLTNSDRSVVLYQEDFNLLFSMGLDPRWRISNNQVLERGRARVSVARLVADASKGDKIQYFDRDPCNLRRKNLVYASGAGKDKTRAKLGSTPKRLFDKASLKHTHILPSWEQPNG